MDPEGEDTNPGTESKPFATIMKVQEVVAAGDVVYINPGIYVVPADQPPMTTTTNGLYHCVFDMSKSGEAGKPIWQILISPVDRYSTFLRLSQWGSVSLCFI